MSKRHSYVILLFCEFLHAPLNKRIFNGLQCMATSLFVSSLAESITYLLRSDSGNAVTTVMQLIARKKLKVMLEGIRGENGGVMISPLLPYLTAAVNVVLSFIEMCMCVFFIQCYCDDICEHINFAFVLLA